MDDSARIAYYESYIAEMHEAIEQGADVRGYYAWSFMDNFGETRQQSLFFAMPWYSFLMLRTYEMGC